MMRSFLMSLGLLIPCLISGCGKPEFKCQYSDVYLSGSINTFNFQDLDSWVKCKLNIAQQQEKDRVLKLTRMLDELDERDECYPCFPNLSDNKTERLMIRELILKDPRKYLLHDDDHACTEEELSLVVVRFQAIFNKVRQEMLGIEPSKVDDLLAMKLGQYDPNEDPVNLFKLNCINLIEKDGYKDLGEKLGDLLYATRSPMATYSEFLLEHKRQLAFDGWKSEWEKVSDEAIVPEEVSENVLSARAIKLTDTIHFIKNLKNNPPEEWERLWKNAYWHWSKKPCFHHTFNDLKLMDDYLAKLAPEFKRTTALVKAAEDLKRMKEEERARQLDQTRRGTRAFKERCLLDLLVRAAVHSGYVGAAFDEFRQVQIGRIKRMPDDELDSRIIETKAVCKRNGIPINDIEMPYPSDDKRNTEEPESK